MIPLDLLSAPARRRCSRELARAAERAFAGGFAARLAALRRYPDPARPLATLDAGAPVYGADERGARARLAESRRATPEALRDGPRGERCSAVLRRAGLLGSRPALVLAAGQALRLERHLIEGGDAEPADRALLDRSLDALGLPAELPAHVGVLSPTGWGSELTPDAASSPGRLVALVSLAPGTPEDAPVFRVALPAGAPPELGALLDPEPPHAKRARARDQLARDPRLAAPGGLILLDGLDQALGVPPHELDAAVAELLRNDPGLAHEFIEGSWVVRRPRR